MQILVDADACPVKKVIVAIAEEYGLGVVMLIDTSHMLDDGYSRVITVDKARDGVDIALINLAKRGDIVVTQDFGLAALALGKGAFAINQNGLVFSGDNMDKLLFERFLGQKIRRAGGRTTNPGKRGKEDDMRFEAAFRKMVASAVAKDSGQQSGRDEAKDG